MNLPSFENCEIRETVFGRGLYSGRCVPPPPECRHSEGDDITRLIQIGGWIAGDASLAESEEDFPLRAELHDLVPFACSVWKLLELRRRGGSCVGHPYIAIAVHMKTMREYEDAAAETPHEFSDASNLSTTGRFEPAQEVRPVVCQL